MSITDNVSYVNQAMAGFMGLLMAQGAASAESKFLSLFMKGCFRGRIKSPTSAGYGSGDPLSILINTEGLGSRHSFILHFQMFGLFASA